jgi:hypothetical protein
MLQPGNKCWSRLPRRAGRRKCSSDGVGLSLYVANAGRRGPIRSPQWVIHHFCGVRVERVQPERAKRQEARPILISLDPGAVGTLPFSDVRMPMTMERVESPNAFQDRALLEPDEMGVTSPEGVCPYALREMLGLE